MNQNKIIVTDSKESFLEAVEKALADGYLPVEEYSTNEGYYIGKFSLDPETSVTKEEAMKNLERAVIKTTRTRKVKA